MIPSSCPYAKANAFPCGGPRWPDATRAPSNASVGNAASAPPTHRGMKQRRLGGGRAVRRRVCAARSCEGRSPGRPGARWGSTPRGSVREHMLLSTRPRCPRQWRHPDAGRLICCRRALCDVPCCRAAVVLCCCLLCGPRRAAHTQCSLYRRAVASLCLGIASCSSSGGSARYPDAPPLLGPLMAAAQEALVHAASLLLRPGDAVAAPARCARIHVGSATPPPAGSHLAGLGQRVGLRMCCCLAPRSLPGQ